MGGIASPNIFDFEVCGLHCIENYRNCCHLMYILGLKGSKFDFGWGSAPNPAGELAALPDPQLTPFPLSALETTCLPKYVSLNPLMVLCITAVSVNSHWYACMLVY